MKKFAYLLLVLALILAISPAVFALSGEGTADAPYQTVDGDEFTVPAGETVYCSGKFAGKHFMVSGLNDDCVVYINYRDNWPDPNGVVEMDIPAMVPSMDFQIENNSEEDLTVKITAQSAKGTMGNPEVIEELGEIVTELPDVDGQMDEFIYFYTWTATHDGVLTYTVNNAPAYNEYKITLVNTNTYDADYGEWVSVGETTEAVVNVNKGDVISLEVENGGDPEYDYALFEATVIGSLKLSYPGIDAQHPLNVQNGDKVTAAPGETLYCVGMFMGKELTVSGANYTVTYNGQEYTSFEAVMVEQNCMGGVQFAITNNGDADAEYTISAAAPLGSMDNPENIPELGEVDVTLPESMENSEYWYTWTAAATGTLTVETVTPPANVFYSLGVVNTESGNSIYSDMMEYGVPTSISIKVSKGDVININLINGGDDNWELSEDTLSIKLSFVCEHGETELVGQKDATCTEKGYSGDKVCSDCGELIEKGHETDALGHKYVEKDGKEVCEHCGEPKPTNPETADTASALIAVIAVLSLGGAVALVENRKKF